MTIAGISEAAGCGVNTVTRWVQKNMPGRMVKGRKTVFTRDEATKIMAGLPKRNLVDLHQTVQVPAPIGGTELAAQIMALVPAIVAETIKAFGLVQPPVRPSARQLAASVPEIPVRTLINNLVHDYVREFGEGPDAFQVAWNRLYKEYDDRFGGDSFARAKARGLSRLDYLEMAGELDHLYAVAIRVYGLGVRT